MTQEKSVFEMDDFDNHESVHFFADPATGYRSLIAVHDSTLGPACGGTRMWAYENSQAALRDVLRLSRGMSYKNACADLPLGGGKAVVIGDARREKTEALMRAHGRAIDSLGGRYVTAEDVGMTENDMRTIATATKHVAGISQPGRAGGDPSPLTALGVFVGIRAAVKFALGSDLKGVRVAVQGLGNVGYDTARRLHEAGAELIVTDVHRPNHDRAVAEFGARTVAPEDILSVDCDVLSPCALGAVVNDRSLPKLKARIVAGAANNQLARPEHGDALHAMGVLYAPDYVINAGGITRVCGELMGWTEETIRQRTEKIADRLTEIFKRSKTSGTPTYALADEIAREKIAAGRKQRAA